jgi:zinc protease
MILADYILGGPTSSRLFRRIREKEGLSYMVQSAFHVPTGDDGATFMAVAVANPSNAPKVEASFQDEMAHTLKDGFTADEVSAAKTAWEQERQVQRSQDQALAGTLMARERFGRTLDYDKSLEAKVAALTPEQVSAAFRRHIDMSGVTMVKAGDFKKANVYQ